MRIVRPIIILIGLVAIWQAIVILTGAPPYILPGPESVLATWMAKSGLIFGHAGITLLEIILGLAIGVTLGMTSALTMIFWRSLRPWLLPVLVVSQAIPVFALAPILVLWLGYGIASKVAMAALIIFFPVTAAFYDGLRRTDPLWLDVALIHGYSKRQILRYVQLPAALPALASGVRVAVSVAPIGAIVGEWVGSSSGLGYLMLHANARMQIDTMFAALFTLAIIAVSLYYLTDFVIRRALPWQHGEALTS